MRKPTITAKRVLGAVLATTLSVAGAVALADTSQATTTPAMTLTPSTANAAGGTVLVLKGKGFQDSTGANVALQVGFSSTACTTTVVASGSRATSFNVVSATKIVATTPALSAATYYACVWDVATGTATNILGQATLVTNAAPTTGAITPNTSSVTTASVLGGTTVSVAGGNFTKTTAASVDGVAAKTTYVSATKLSVVLPAHAAGTGYALKLTSEYGSVNATGTVTYASVVSISPAVGGTAAGTVVTLTGVGFNALDFTAATAGKAAVVFIPAGTTLSNSVTVATLNPCTSVNVESDTSLSCQTPALSGAYTAAIITRDATTPANWGAAVTTFSRSATFTALAL